MLKEKNDKTFIEKHTKMIKESDEKIEKILNIISIIMEELKLKENEGYTGKMVSFFNYVHIHSNMLTESHLSEHKKIMLEEEQKKQSILAKFKENKQINSSLLEEFKETNIKTLFDDVLKIDFKEITVNYLFNDIWKYISDTSKNCENIKFINRFKWLVRFVDIIETSNILLYNRELKKKLK